MCAPNAIAVQTEFRDAHSLWGSIHCPSLAILLTTLTVLALSYLDMRGPITSFVLHMQPHLDSRLH